MRVTRGPTLLTATAERGIGRDHWWALCLALNPTMTGRPSPRPIRRFGCASGTVPHAIPPLGIINMSGGLGCESAPAVPKVAAAGTICRELMSCWCRSWPLVRASRLEEKDANPDRDRQQSQNHLTEQAQRSVESFHRTRGHSSAA